jgi:hypothetical protein
LENGTCQNSLKSSRFAPNNGTTQLIFGKNSLKEEKRMHNLYRLTIREVIQKTLVSNFLLSLALAVSCSIWSQS